MKLSRSRSESGTNPSLRLASRLEAKKCALYVVGSELFRFRFTTSIGCKRLSVLFHLFRIHAAAQFILCVGKPVSVALNLLRQPAQLRDVVFQKQTIPQASTLG